MVDLGEMVCLMLVRCSDMGNFMCGCVGEFLGVMVWKDMVGWVGRFVLGSSRSWCFFIV